MMKKGIMICLLLFLILPTSNVLADFYWAYLFSDHRMSHTGEVDYRMIATAGVDSESVAVTLDLPDRGVQFELAPHAPYVWDPTYFEYLNIIHNPPPGDWYETRYQFLVSDGTASPLYSHAATNIFPMDFVQAQISGSVHPTIAWGAVEHADRYQIRFFDPVTWERLFEQAIDDDGSDAYSYIYSGNLFEEHETLIIRVAARDYNDGQIVNRSHVSYEHMVPIPAAILMLGSGIIGITGVRWRHRKR